MGINKYVEMYCDNCGNADHYSGSSIKLANEQWKDLGGIVVKGKHYCNEKCQKEAEDKEILCV